MFLSKDGGGIQVLQWSIQVVCRSVEILQLSGVLSKVTCPLGCSSKVKCIQGSVSLNESSVKDEPQPYYSSQNGYLLSKKQCIDMKRKIIYIGTTIL